MKNSQQNSATTSNIEMSSACFGCNKQIADGQWFCRLPQKANEAAVPQEAKILLCSPFCALRYFEDSQPRGKNFEPDYDGYKRSLHSPAH